MQASFNPHQGKNTSLLKREVSLYRSQCSFSRSSPGAGNRVEAGNKAAVS